ncbi:hypothetical protein BCR39DRAFT_587609 [Naematelia encephala]|uniref:Zn(2)-C6 fungal-type domain-containing protein n=1 Tax=Naematelia encephala TaxID=71784 RepID=A0A1Y2B950_9TREE|nr:hypothetical protein BCR39DRAFT_587609 [Naematelia encephala]
MAPIRIKESCMPCRQRKSRCDNQRPCSSCTLRSTERDCNDLTHAPSATAPYPPPRVPQHVTPSPTSQQDASTYPTPPEASSTPARRALMEIQHLKASIRDLETHIRSLEVQSTSPAVGDVDPEERIIWDTLKAALPPRAACEILLEFLVQECDWLWLFGDIISIWQTTLARGACSASIAGMMCMSLSIAALLLGPQKNLLYRPQVDLVRLQMDLVQLALSFAPSRPERIEDFDCVLPILLYHIYSGRRHQLPQRGAVVLETATELGLFDETLPSWNGLGPTERETRRRIGQSLIQQTRWSMLISGSQSSSSSRYNLCRPSYRTHHLSGPISLPQLESPDEGAPTPSYFRAFHVKSEYEQQRTIDYWHLSHDFAELLPRARAYMDRVEAGANTDTLASMCDSLYSELLIWREQKMPAAGYPFLDVDDVDYTEPSACREAAQGLVLYHAIAHLSAVILRRWLLDSDDSPVTPTKSRLREACIANAESSMRTMPVIRALLASNFGPFIAPFASANLFNAAMCFAVPVLRAVRQRTSHDREDDIRALPAWPDAMYPKNSNGLRLQGDLANKQLPSSIYSDPTVRRSANNILIIFDALSDLGTSPLGTSAKERLSQLIQQFGLADSQALPVQAFDNSAFVMSQMDFSHLPAPQSQFLDANGSTEGIPPWQMPPADMQFDQAIFDELLQMDSSIWQGLLESHVVPGA